MADLGIRTAYRIRIAGVKESFVTDPALEGTDSDGHQYIRGLKRDGLRIEEEIALPDMEYESDGMSVTIVERQRDHAVAKALFRRPTRTLFADPSSGDIAVGDTSITVTGKGSDVFSNGDYAWIGPECVKVTSASNTSLSVDRAQLGTTAIKHYVSNEDGTPMQIAIHDRPPTIQGRPVELYEYVDADLSAGDKGTLIWRGRCSTAPKKSGGTSWRLSLDPAWSVMDFSLGAGLEKITGPRGIYYPDNNPFYVLVWAGETVTKRRFSGFWEDQSAFIEHINTQLDSDIASASSPTVDRVRLFPTNDGRWTFTVTTTASFDASTGDDFNVEMRSPMDGKLELNADTVQEEGVAQASTTYEAIDRETSALDYPRSVPRGSFGIFQNSADTDFEATPKNSKTWSPLTLYLNGPTDDMAGEAMSLKTESTEGKVRISSVDADTNSLTLELPAPGNFRGVINLLNFVQFNASWSGQSSLETQLIKRFATGSLADFRDALVGDAPTQVGLGNMPMVTSSDLATWSSVVSNVQATSELLGTRYYEAAGGTDLTDLFTHEFRLYSVYPGLDSNGAVRLNRLELPSAGITPDVTIASGDILTGESWPTIEAIAMGVKNSVTYKTGWDPVEEEHTGTTWKARNVESVSEQGGQIQEIEVAPMSRWQSNVSHKASNFVDLAKPVTETFGNTYYVAECAVPAQKFRNSALLGATVLFSSNHVNDPDTGELGLSSKAGFIVGRDYDITRGIINLKMMLVGKPIYGLSPPLTITSSTNTTGDLYRQGVTTVFPYGSGIDMWPSSVNIGDIYEPGMKVRLNEIGSGTLRTSGTVSAVSSASGHTAFITVDWGGTDPGSAAFDRKFMDFDEATAIGKDSDQAFYVYVADDEGEVSFSDVTTTDVPNYRVYGV